MTSPSKERAFRSDFPDFHSFFTKSGERFGFINNHLLTDSVDVLAELDILIKKPANGIEEIDPSEIPENTPKKSQSRMPEEAKNSETTISPSALQARMAALQAQNAPKAEVSQVLEQAAQPQANIGIVSSSKLGGNSAESNAASSAKAK